MQPGMPRWHCLLTKPRQERRVVERLSAKDVEVFLPMLEYKGRRGNWLQRPFFPRYVFARFSWDGADSRGLRWTPGLSQIVTFEGQPAWLDEEELAFLKDRVAHFDGEAYLALKPGERVRVKSGPFKHYEAIFDEQVNGERRVAILLDILGRKTRVCLGEERLERIA